MTNTVLIMIGQKTSSHLALLKTVSIQVGGYLKITKAIHLQLVINKNIPQQVIATVNQHSILDVRLKVSGLT